MFSTDVEKTQGLLGLTDGTVSVKRSASFPADLGLVFQWILQKVLQLCLKTRNLISSSKTWFLSLEIYTFIIIFVA